MEPRPPVTRMTHPLPFEKLGPDDFERLCLWLVRREGYEEAEHFGAKGTDQGRDVVAWRAERRVVFQCKRVERFGPAEAEKELAKLLDLPAEAQPQDVVFVVTATVTAATRDRASAAWGERGSCTIWASSELDERVHRHLDILKKFFDLGEAEPGTVFQAHLEGAGAIAQGEGAVAAGAGGVAIGKVGGDVHITVPAPPKPPRPPEALLGIWLDRVARAHRQLMPYFERRGAPLLEHVYVELQLSPQHRHRQGRPS